MNKCPNCGKDLVMFNTNQDGSRHRNLVQCQCGYLNKADDRLFTKAEDIPVVDLSEGTLVAHEYCGIGIVLRLERWFPETPVTEGQVPVIFFNYSPVALCKTESLCVVRLNHGRWLTLLEQSGLIDSASGEEWYAPAGLDRSIQQTVDIEAGEGCRKGVPGCMCKINWPPDKQCPDCREDQPRDSYCVCPPKF